MDTPRPGDPVGTVTSTVTKTSTRTKVAVITIAGAIGIAAAMFGFAPKRDAYRSASDDRRTSSEDRRTTSEDRRTVYFPPPKGARAPTPEPSREEPTPPPPAAVARPFVLWDANTPVGVQTPGMSREIARIYVENRRAISAADFTVEKLYVQLRTTAPLTNAPLRLRVYNQDRSVLFGESILRNGVALNGQYGVRLTADAGRRTHVLGQSRAYLITLDTTGLGGHFPNDQLSVSVDGIAWRSGGVLNDAADGLPLSERTLTYP